MLSCPGLELRGLERYAELPPTAVEAPKGLETELLAVRAAWSLPDTRGRAERARSEISRLYRRAATRSGWGSGLDLLSLRSRAGPTALLAADAEPPPPLEEGLDLLPLYWSGPQSIGALASGPEGILVLQLRPAGGLEARRGPFPEIDVPPSLDAQAERLLEGYLAYVAARSQFQDGSVAGWLADPRGATFEEFFQGELEVVAATVVQRAEVLARAGGGPGVRLGGSEILQGIRATDADLLDRPGPGDLL